MIKENKLQISYSKIISGYGDNEGEIIDVIFDKDSTIYCCERIKKEIFDHSEVTFEKNNEQISMYCTLTGYYYNNYNFCPFCGTERKLVQKNSKVKKQRIIQHITEELEDYLEDCSYEKGLKQK
jgi:hypothetical protein